MQKKINFGTFPDDPSADAIRTAFNKTQQNLTEVYSGLAQVGVQSINKSAAGPGISVNSPTGNIQISANIANVRMTTTSLKMGVGSNSGTTVDLSKSSQTIVIDLPQTVRTGNIILTGDANVTGDIVGKSFSVGSTPVIDSTGHWVGPSIFGESGFSGAQGSIGQSGYSGYSGTSIFDTAFTHDAASSSNGTYATGILTFTGQPSDGQEIAIGRQFASVIFYISTPIDGDSFDINGRTYVLQDTLTNVDGHIKIGATNELTTLNIVAAINLTGTPGVDYAATMTQNADVTSRTWPAVSYLEFTAKIGGTGGNSITVSSASELRLYFNGATTLLNGGGPDPYVFQTILTDVARHVQIGATPLESFENLVAAIMLTIGAGTKYATSTLINAEVRATLVGSDITVFSKDPWLANGNGTSLESYVTGAAWNGPVTSGGIDIMFGYFGGRIEYPAGNGLVTPSSVVVKDNTTNYVYAQSGDMVIADARETLADFLFASVTTSNGNITAVQDLRTPFVAFSDYNTGSVKLGQGPRPIGYNQIAIGANALTGTTGTSRDNIAIGDNNMWVVTDGQNNVGIGHGVLQTLTSGSKNIGVGSGSLSSLTTGANNIVLGATAGTSLTTENDNVIIGNDNGSALVGLNGQLIISNGLGNVKFSSIGETLQLGDVNTTFNTVKIGNQTLTQNISGSLPVDPLSHNPATTANGIPAIYGYNGGKVRHSTSGIVFNIIAGTVSIEPSTIATIYIDPSNAASVQVSITGTVPNGAFRMAVVTVDSGGNITSIVDERAWANIQELPLTSQVFSRVATGNTAGTAISVPGIGFPTLWSSSQLTLVLEHVIVGGVITDIVDLTSEFVIGPSLASTISNAGGTDTTGNKLLVQWLDYAYK